MKKLNTVRIRIFHRCDRCGQEEEKPQVIDRTIEPPITYDEIRERVTVEVLYTAENDEYAPDEEAEMKIVEKEVKKGKR